MLVGGGGVVRPRLPPDSVQLEMPPMSAASNAASSSARLRRRKAKGKSASPQASGRTGQATGRERLAEGMVSPVAISTVTLLLPLAAMPILAGLKVQALFGGRPLH